MSGFFDGAEVWRLKAEQGLPLEFALSALWRVGRLPVWETLLVSAKQDGVNLDRLVRDLRQELPGIYPPPGVAAAIGRRPPLLLARMTA